jgi:protein CpxP
MIRRYPRTLAAGAAILLVAGLSAGVYAQDPGRRGPMGRARHGMFGSPSLRQLDLTEAQREQVREIRQRYEAQRRDAGEQLRKAHQAQRAAVEALPVNEGLIRSTTQALATAQTEMALLHARVHSDVWAILTPEQQEKAKQLRAQRETRMKQRLERRQRNP